MVELLSSHISSYFPQVAKLYYQLIVVKRDTPSLWDAAGTELLRDRTSQINFQLVAESTNSQYININLELSRKLLELTPRQRSLKVPRLLAEIIGNTDNRVIFLDHLEILFDNSIKQDPLRCLQDIARNRTIVAVWDGKIENNHLIYAEPGHPEYRRYPIKDFLVVNIEQPEANPSK